MADTEATWHVEAVLRAATGTMRQRMEKATIVVRDQIRVLSNRGNPKGTSPSAPGEPPKRVSGTYFKSLSQRVVQDGEDIVGIISSNVPYQPRLELGFVGTDSRGRVYQQAPRPSMRPGLERSKPTIRTILGVDVAGS